MGARAVVSRRWTSCAVALASLGGIGRFPVAPATLCSAVITAAYVAVPLDAAMQLALIAVVIVLGVWSSGIAAVAAGDDDPKHVVIDEVAGMLIACFLLPKTPAALAGAFLLFRLFDIGKWFPMKQLERLPGGWGIMADDLAAGVLARLVLRIWL